MKLKSLKPAMGFAVYRPDGTVHEVFPQAMRVTADQRANLIGWAHHEDNKDPDKSGHVTFPAAAIAAKKAGYRVVRVTITPSR